MSVERASITTTLLLGGGVLMFFSQQIGHELPIDARWEGTFLMLISTIVFLLGNIAVYKENFSVKLETIIRKISNWLDIKVWQALFLAIGLLLPIFVSLAAGAEIKMHSPAIAIVAWILSMTLAIIGSYNQKRSHFHINKEVLIWSICLFVLAFQFRGIATDKLPIFLTGDEASAGINATQFTSGEWNNTFIVGWFSFPTLYYYIQSIFIQLFGQTTIALRIPSAIIGSLTVVAVYLVGRKMFSHRVGIISALFLSTFHYHVHFSRIGLNNIWDGFWYTVVVGALWYGWKFEDRKGYLVAGVGLGFSQYFYPSSRTLFVFILFCGLLAFIFEREKLKRAYSNLTVSAIIAFVIVAPLYFYYIKYPEQFFAPLSRVSIFSTWLKNEITTSGSPAWIIFIKQISTGFQAYTHTPLRAWYQPNTPILRPLDAVFFYIGIIVLLTRYRERRSILLILWLLIFGLIGGLSEPTPAAQRYVAVAPACALVIGNGISGLADILAKIWTKRKTLFAIPAFVILAILMATNWYFYFIDFTQIALSQNTNSPGAIAQGLADNLKTQPKGTQVIFFGSPLMGYYSISSTYYLAPQVFGVDINQPWNEVDKEVITGDQLIFVFLNNHESEIPLVQDDYPRGDLRTVQTWNNEVLFWMYEVNTPNDISNDMD